MTAQGIVTIQRSSGEYPKKMFDLELLITVKMQPTANVIVYYSHKGEVILNYLKIEPIIQLSNTVSK